MSDIELILFRLAALYAASNTSLTNLKDAFNTYNKEFIELNKDGAEIAWDSSINPERSDLPERAARYQNARYEWQFEFCNRFSDNENYLKLDDDQKRQYFLACKGPKFNLDEAGELSRIYEELQSAYNNGKVCFNTDINISKPNITAIEDMISYIIPHSRIIDLEERIRIYHPLHQRKVFCWTNEDEVNRLFKQTKEFAVLEWLWGSWRDSTLPRNTKSLFLRMAEISNAAAERNGYKDLGEAWRNDLEIQDLRELCYKLLQEIQPLYRLLHAVVRHAWQSKYNLHLPEKRLIPAHLLGDLWSQDWESLIDLVSEKTIDLNSQMKNLNWTVHHMLKRAEDFYQSLGLPPMTEKFWRNSVLERIDNNTRCHGTAADMYSGDDYRLLYCSNATMEDFYVIHHEMGHIQYYMAYAHQPGLYRQAHEVLHETIGDTIMLGVLTPQHLNRLGLVNDSILISNEKQYVYKRPDEKSSDGLQFTTNQLMLLQTALNKIPQIPFGYLLDEYRWRLFEGSLDEDHLNAEYWNMAAQIQGITPPEPRTERYFDVAAKFHVPDNTPYIRYFLASFLQYQLFEALCKITVFGKQDCTNYELPESFILNRCDIYGSKAVGKVLKNLMSRGHSQNWRQILSETTGITGISSEALMRYYYPLKTVLEDYVKVHNITVGWSTEDNWDDDWVKNKLFQLQ